VDLLCTHEKMQMDIRHIRIDEETWQALREESFRRGTQSCSALVRESVRRAIRSWKAKTPQERTEEV